jgi:hypothetical protein
MFISSKCYEFKHGSIGENPLYWAHKIIARFLPRAFLKSREITSSELPGKTGDVSERHEVYIGLAALAKYFYDIRQNQP